MNESDQTRTSVTKNNVGLIRRLFAILYDSFLLIAILFIVTWVATALNHGKAIEPDDSYYPLFVFIVFILCYLYFAWFWIHGGQSLGMKTWRIRLTAIDDREIGWKDATIRFFGAILSWGVFTTGFLWSLIDRKNHCWHDLISKTELHDLRNT